MREGVFLMMNLVCEQQVKIGQLKQAVSNLHGLEKSGQLFVFEMGRPKGFIPERVLTDVGYECFRWLCELMGRPRPNQITTIRAIHTLRTRAEQRRDELERALIIATSQESKTDEIAA